MFGAEAAPKLVGDLSGYIPLVSLIGAAVGGMVGQMAGMFVGRRARQAFGAIPPLRALDSAGGVMLGALTGLALCWAVGAVLLYVPGQSELRRMAQESVVVSALTEALPPERVMDAVGRIDPFTAFAGPDVDVAEPDPGDRRVSRMCEPPAFGRSHPRRRLRARRRGLRLDRPARARRHERPRRRGDPVAARRSRRAGTRVRGEVVAFDAANDVALVRADGLDGRPLRLAERGARHRGCAPRLPAERPLSS